jgi:glutathione S-transferase
VVTLYQFEISPFCDKVRRVLHFKGVEYEVREVPVLDASLGYRRVNPTGKVPTLEHDGRRIGDSTEIARYLEERFPEPPLVPHHPAERALCHLLEDWADESLYFYEVRLRFGEPHNVERWVPRLVKHDHSVLRPLVGFAVPRALAMTMRSQGIGRKSRQLVLEELARHIEAIAGWLGDREWLVGARPSLADIAVFAQLYGIRGTEEGEQLVRAAPAVGAWMARVDEATRRGGDSGT